MAIRMRENGRMFCAASHPEEKNDLYIDDALHYELSVEKRILVTEPYEKHIKNGEWWWKNNISKDIEIDEFYK